MVNVELYVGVMRYSFDGGTARNFKSKRDYQLNNQIYHNSLIIFKAKYFTKKTQ